MYVVIKHGTVSTGLRPKHADWQINAQVVGGTRRFPHENVMNVFMRNESRYFFKRARLFISGVELVKPLNPKNPRILFADRSISRLSNREKAL